MVRNTADMRQFNVIRQELLTDACIHPVRGFTIVTLCAAALRLGVAGMPDFAVSVREDYVLVTHRKCRHRFWFKRLGSRLDSEVRVEPSESLAMLPSDLYRYAKAAAEEALARLSETRFGSGAS